MGFFPLSLPFFRPLSTLSYSNNLSLGHDPWPSLTTYSVLFRKHPQPGVYHISFQSALTAPLREHCRLLQSKTPDLFLWTHPRAPHTCANIVMYQNAYMWLRYMDLTFKVYFIYSSPHKTHVGKNIWFSNQQDMVWIFVLPLPSCVTLGNRVTVLVFGLQNEVAVNIHRRWTKEDTGCKALEYLQYGMKEESSNTTKCCWIQF